MIQAPEQIHTDARTITVHRIVPRTHVHIQVHGEVQVELQVHVGVGLHKGTNTHTHTQPDWSIRSELVVLTKENRGRRRRRGDRERGGARRGDQQRAERAQHLIADPLASH
jgi:hypothetical protein